jgi:hypothetical protein
MTSPPLTYLCECKYWSGAVPKSIVHGLRIRSFRLRSACQLSHFKELITEWGVCRGKEFKSDSEIGLNSRNIH